MRTRTYHKANQYQNKSKQNKTIQSSDYHEPASEERSDNIVTVNDRNNVSLRLRTKQASDGERERWGVGRIGERSGVAFGGTAGGGGALHDEHLARAETKRNRPKQNSRSVTVPQPTPTVAVIPRGYGDKNITSMLANYFAPLRRLVDRDTARRFFRPLPPPLLSGFLWSTSRGSPFFRPTLRRALFRIDRNLRCFGDP
jgi:hypothetical protein